MLFGTGEVLESCLYVNISNTSPNEAQSPTQEFGGWRHSAVKFIDDRRLLVSLPSAAESPSSLMLVDTDDAGGTPTQTFFHLPPFFSCFGNPPILLEQGAHSPANTEPLTPFYQDPTQQIVVLNVQSVSSTPHRLVFQAGALLQLLEGREGSEIGWDEWKNVVFLPSQDWGCYHIWVSGCRLIICGADQSQCALVQVYDFSMRGLAKSLTDEASHGTEPPEFVAAFRSTARYLLPTEVRTPIPRGSLSRSLLHICFDGFVFVSVTIFSLLERD